MDAFLNIRIILAPSLFFGSLLVAALLGDPQFICTIKNLQPQAVAAIVSIVAGALLPLGYVIGGLTRLILYLLWVPLKDPYEASLSNTAWEYIWRWLGINPQRGWKNKASRLWAASTFVRVGLDKSLFELIDRYGLISKAYASCVIALLLSGIIAHFFLGIHLTCKWYLLSGLAAIICLLMALKTRCDSIGILEFLSQELNGRRSTEHKPSQLYDF
jgi:hypothetical protein